MSYRSLVQRRSVALPLLVLGALACEQSPPQWNPIGSGETTGDPPATTSDTDDSTTEAPTTDGPSTTEEPYEEGTPLSRVVPGRIEAESFVRGAGITGDRANPNCATPSSEEVLLVAQESASNGCYVSPVDALAWIEFDIEVSEAGTYDVTAAVQAPEGASAVHVRVDDAYRGRFEVSRSLGLRPVELTGLSLTAGPHVLKLSFDTGLTDVDYLEFTAVGACTPTCSSRACGDDFCGGSCGSCDEGVNCSSAGQCLDGFDIPVEAHGQLRIEGNEFVDEHGEVVQLRGISTQWLNWEQVYSTNRAGLQFLRDDWGLQVLRIANGVENDGGYAEEAGRTERLAMVKGIIDNAIELGVYVLVDWHTHEPEHMELSKEFFADIAQTYGELPNILYEPFNEPIGDFNSISGDGAEEAYWDDELKPYLEEMVAHIRQHDPDNVIVLGTPQWSQGLQQPTRNPLQGDNLAYTLHFYSCTHTEWLMDRVQGARDAGLAVFATEWAATHSDGGTPENPEPCIDAARSWHQFLDENHVSSAAWKLAADGDASSLFAHPPSATGPFLEEDLSEHGKLVRQLLQTR